MNEKEILQIIEALLFATPEPLTQVHVNTIFEDDAPDLNMVADMLSEKYSHGEHAFMIEKVSGGYQLVSRPEFEPWIERLLRRSGKLSLSQAALETLAIVAYKQPLSRYEIESIRGVDTTGVLKKLLSRNLIKIKGRDQGPGRPLLYGTTGQFLEHFGLDSLSELPKLKEIAELTEDRDQLEQIQVNFPDLENSKHDSLETGVENK